MYYFLRTYIYLHARNYFLNVLLSEDIHIFTCEELFSECSTLWGHTLYCTCEELFSECTTLWGHTYIYMWGTIFWVYYSLRTYIYLHWRNYFLSVLLSEDIHIFTCEELLSECTTLWGHTYIYMRGTIFWVYYSLMTYIYLHVRNYFLSVLLPQDIHIITCEELFCDCTTLWGHTYIYMWATIVWMYYSLRTYIYLHVRNYFLSVLLSEDIHIFTCEELLSECTTFWGHTYIYMRGTIFWMYYSLRTYIYLHVRNYFLNVLLSEDIHILYMWGAIFWVYYSLRIYIFLHVKKYFLNVLLSEDIHIFICEKLFSECTTLWGHTNIYMWRTIFWMYYSLKTHIYLHARNYFMSVLFFEDIHIFTCEELFSECTTLWGHKHIYMWGTILRV
jgi:hypothetical protein